MTTKRTWLAVCLLALLTAPAAAQVPEFTRTEDVIYGRKLGMALTMDVLTPAAGANGAGIIWCISGGWFSSHDNIKPEFVAELLKRGYVVFAVCHGSNPKFTIPEAVADMNRAVRYIRTNAAKFKVDPERLGITGGSAGGHLSLMIGTAGDKGKADAKDPVDRASSRVKAVACFFPPTDFLNYGEPGKDALGRGTLASLKAAFDFTEWDAKTRSFVHVDEKRLLDIGKAISPITHVSSDDPPTLVIHGDADKVVPLQQAESFIAKLKEAGVPCELVVKKGAAHGWPDLVKDMAAIADWFDKHLAAPK